MFFTIVGFAAVLGGLLWLLYFDVKEFYNYIRYRFHPDTFDMDDLGEVGILIAWGCILCAGIYFTIIYSPFDISIALEIKK
jgi:hypothetical protein